MPGTNGNDEYNCRGGMGHKVIVGYEWKRLSSGGEIPPSAVQNVPASLLADINGDGAPDAFWDNNLTMRRMEGSLVESVENFLPFALSQPISAAVVGCENIQQLQMNVRIAKSFQPMPVRDQEIFIQKVKSYARELMYYKL